MLTSERRKGSRHGAHDPAATRKGAVMRFAVKIALLVALIAAVVNPSLGAGLLNQAHDALTSVSTQVREHLGDTTVPDTRASTVTQQASLAPKYAFTTTNPGGTPARWNPCQVHTILVNPAGAPAGAVADLRAAVKKLDDATGLRFKIGGTTRAVPSDSYGLTAVNGKWAPIVVAWGKPGSSQLLTGGEVGGAQPVWVENATGKNVFVSASIVFSTETAQLTAGFKPGTVSRGALMLHELGHLAGLGHVADTHQIMYPYIGGAVTYQPGDLKGLRALGAGGCLAVPTP